ncbi:hypothetical protein BpHYR1_023742 [Brachionus plicatilis]|uniref:Uncharacterized protein n=1 Tax=Brachionus plicatilis TaxID=10195 RepID=A0A3M7RQ85_BRAPC|nr:hypothetical protein BpHYR1_023742 [Brachionus plicatilis]
MKDTTCNARIFNIWANNIQSTLEMEGEAGIFDRRNFMRMYTFENAEAETFHSLEKGKNELERSIQKLDEIENDIKINFKKEYDDFYKRTKNKEIGELKIYWEKKYVYGMFTNEEDKIYNQQFEFNKKNKLAKTQSKFLKLQGFFIINL